MFKPLRIYDKVETLSEELDWYDSPRTGRKTVMLPPGYTYRSHKVERVDRSNPDNEWYVESVNIDNIVVYWMIKSWGNLFDQKGTSLKLIITVRGVMDDEEWNRQMEIARRHEETIKSFNITPPTNTTARPLPPTKPFLGFRLYEAIPLEWAQKTSDLNRDSVLNSPNPSPMNIYDHMQCLVVDSDLQLYTTTKEDEEESDAVDTPSDMPTYEALNPHGIIKRAYELYENRCECGRRYANNCAHFLSNAYMKAFKFPYKEGSITSFPQGMEVCPAGRPIRAKEMQAWFKSISTDFRADHAGINQWYWNVYQEDSSGQGHVCIHKHANGSFGFKGTGNYPQWPVQWHYFY